MITALLAARLADRVIVAIAPVVLGRGTEAVGELGVAQVTDGIRLVHRTVVTAGDDVVLAWDVAPTTVPDAAPVPVSAAGRI